MLCERPPNGSRSGGVTTAYGTNSSKTCIAPSLKGEYFGKVRLTSSGIVHEMLHANHIFKNLPYFNRYTEYAASTYTYAYLKAYGSAAGASFYLPNIMPYPQAYSWKNLPNIINTGIK